MQDEKVIRGVRFRPKTAFLTSVTSGGQTVDLRSILTEAPVMNNSYCLSNTVIGFALAIIVPEIIEVFRNDA